MRLWFAFNEDECVETFLALPISHYVRALENQRCHDCAAANEFRVSKASLYVEWRTRCIRFWQKTQNGPIRSQLGDVKAEKAFQTRFGEVTGGATAHSNILTWHKHQHTQHTHAHTRTHPSLPNPFLLSMPSLVLSVPRVAHQDYPHDRAGVQAYAS